MEVNTDRISFLYWNCSVPHNTAITIGIHIIWQSEQLVWNYLFIIYCPKLKSTDNGYPVDVTASYHIYNIHTFPH